MDQAAALLARVDDYIETPVGPPDAGHATSESWRILEGDLDSLHTIMG